MSARKPRSTRRGASSTVKAPKRPKAAAPAKPAPFLEGSPSTAPLGFGTRTSELTPSAQGRSADIQTERGMVARQRLETLLRGAPAPAPQSSEHGGGIGLSGRVGGTVKRDPKEIDARERERLAAMRKESAKRSSATVRPDYFGTSEHRASAEQLERMLRGDKTVFPQAVSKQAHVLLRVAPSELVPDAVIERSRLSVASANSSWREPFQARLENLMANYRPLTELEVRPGLTLTYGDVVALAGDYYATPEELAAEVTPAVAKAIRGVTPQDEGTFLLNTHRGWFDYASLANENQDHFAPLSWVRYLVHHAQALRLALERHLDAALVRNAFADHFLTDAFASGHLRVPRNALVGLPGALPTRKMHDEENVQGLWVQSATGFVWRCYGDDHLGTNPVHSTLTAHAVGLSLLRIFKAYRLEDAEREALHDALDEVSEPKLTAGQMVDPRTLPRVLGEVAGLPDIREHLPVPLGSLDTPDTQKVLANYPPQIGLDGKKRKETPDFEAYFRFDT